MKNSIALEIKKALKNVPFWAVVLVGCAITTISAVMKISTYQDTQEYIQKMTASGKVVNTFVDGTTLFNNWIGADVSSVGFSLFYFFFPLFATIPYAWAYCRERNSGYERNLLIREGKFSYYFSKSFATFVSGGLAVVFPLLWNIMLVAAVIPANQPSISYEQYYGIDRPMVWSSLFYSHALLYLVLYLLLDFVFCGLLASLGMVVAYFTRSIVSVMLTPFFAVLLLHYARIILNWTTIDMQISPLYFLHASPVEQAVTWAPILIEGGALLLFTVLSTILRGKRHEVY